MAGQIEGEARLQNRACCDEIRSLEERRERVLVGLRELAAELNGLFREARGPPAGRRRTPRRAPRRAPAAEHARRRAPHAHARLPRRGRGADRGRRGRADRADGGLPHLAVAGTAARRSLDQPPGRRARAPPPRRLLLPQPARRRPGVGRAALRARRPPFADWHGIRTREGAARAPLLDGALGWLECRVAAEHAAGDDTLFVGEVGLSGAGARRRGARLGGGGYVSL